MKSIKLPEKLSELLALALRDLEAVEKDKNYVVRMTAWHAPYKDKCYVCLAGCVLAQTLKVPREQHRNIKNISTDAALKMNALDSLRIGLVTHACETLGLLLPPPGLDREMPAYSNKGFRFKKAIRKLITDLEKAGY